MKVYIELGTDGAAVAAKRQDVIVLIDALRASSTIVCGLAAGASRVIPVVTVEEAFALREQLRCPLAGERGGVKVEGFDYGNSPGELLRNGDALAGRPLILTTSNGTRCVNTALDGGASALLVASPPNATAAVRAIWEVGRSLGRDVALLAAGLDGAPNDEDIFSARVLSQMFQREYAARVESGRKHANPDDSRRVFAGSEAGRRLSRLGYAADVEFCAQFDTLSVVPVYEDGAGFVRWGTRRGSTTLGKRHT